MLTPATRSIVTPAAVSSSSTPMCANARAPPPESTIPIEVPESLRAMRAMSASNSASRIRCDSNGSSAAAQPSSAPGAAS